MPRQRVTSTTDDGDRVNNNAAADVVANDNNNSTRCKEDGIDMTIIDDNNVSTDDEQMTYKLRELMAIDVNVGSNGVAVQSLIPTTKKVHLLQEIKFVSAFGIMVGAIIGSGIFISPVAIVRNCHSVGLSLTIWLVCGLLTMSRALCSLELGLMFPLAGGEYQYLKAINGNFIAFLQAWTNWVYVEPCSQAIMSQTAVIYLLEAVLPSGCQLSTLALKLLSGWLIVTMVILNCLHMRYTTRVQNFLTLMKISALLVIIIGGIIWIAKGNVSNFEAPFESSSTSPSKITIAIYSGLFSYGGWQHIFNLIEEVSKPEKTVQRSLIAALVCVIILYLLANVAYFSVLTPIQIINSPAVAMTFAEGTLGVFASMIPICVACSAIGSLNGALLGGSRTIFAPARDGLLPKEAAMISVKFLTPWTSLWSVCVISLIYTFLFTVDTLIEYQAFIVLTFQCVILGDLLYLRYKRPSLKRPYKIPIFWPAFLFLANIALVVLGYISDPTRKMLSLAVIFSGIPIYWIFVLGQNMLPLRFKSMINSFSRSLQKLLLVLPEEK